MSDNIHKRGDHPYRLSPEMDLEDAEAMRELHREVRSAQGLEVRQLVYLVRNNLQELLHLREKSRNEFQMAGTDYAEHQGVGAFAQAINMVKDGGVSLTETEHSDVSIPEFYFPEGLTSHDVVRLVKSGSFNGGGFSVELKHRNSEDMGLQIHSGSKSAVLVTSDGYRYQARHSASRFMLTFVAVPNDPYINSLHDYQRVGNLLSSVIRTGEGLASAAAHISRGLPTAPVESSLTAYDLRVLASQGKIVVRRLNDLIHSDGAFFGFVIDNEGTRQAFSAYVSENLLILNLNVDDPAQKQWFDWLTSNPFA